ncbi:unnamed protein product [Trifolium pratense]|uniref:Uncharacterized protein n=1 Tax=Trifolium pratense TaxID=57577 RepID=A0ACB0L1L5_TRIPR|nr:unnamed protein product [Trifolium pratense]
MLIKTYQVTKMDPQNSLQLFCSFAFKQNNLEEPYVSLSKKVLDYAKGVPLALKVLGKLLRGRQKEEWESQLQKLEKHPNLEIFNLLKLNYDELDHNQQYIFLDIACFHTGGFVKFVEQTLDCCGFFTHIEMKVLEDSVDRNVTFRAYLDSLPNSLRILHWMAFPQRSLPQDFCPENLVTLEMCYSHLEQLWEEDQVLSNLKRLNLSRSRKLRRLPDLSLCPNIEEVILSDCESLVEVYSSNFLDKLYWLCFDGCKKLERLDIHSNILSRSSGLVALVTTQLQS